jgi:hypothetical protein
MKKLIVAAALSMFAFTTAAYACDGMKNSNSDTHSQASKEKSKDSKAKKESGSDTTKS